MLLIPKLTPKTLYQGLFYVLLLFSIPVLFYILGLISQRGLDLENANRISGESSAKTNALAEKDNKIKEIQNKLDEFKQNNDNLKNENQKLISKNDALNSEVRNLNRINENLREEIRFMLSSTNYTEQKKKIIQKTKDYRLSSSAIFIKDKSLKSSQVSMTSAPFSSKIPSGLASIPQNYIPNTKESEDEKNVSTNN